MKENLKIIELKAENIKKLVAVSIKPDGNVVELTGKNGQGKTSVLDAISWALEGASVIHGEPIRKGQTKAWVTLDLGDIVVKRTFKKGEDGQTTSSITVESKEGATFKSPQAMLDAMLGKLAFDPLAFARMTPKDQFDILKKLVPGVDFEKIDGMNRTDFDRRTVLNRKAKEARSAAAAILISEEGETTPVDERELVDALQKAGEWNADIERRKARREQASREVETGNSVLSEITVKAVDEAKRVEADASAECDRIMAAAKARTKSIIETAQAAAYDLTNKIADLTEKLRTAEPLPEPVDVAIVRNKIDEARKRNEDVRFRLQKIAKRDEADQAEAESSGMTEQIEAREKTKRAAIEAAKLPVSGLTFGDGAILMNGVPFDQASDAEQLRASIAIAMSLNPKLRVIRVRDGSLLDDGSMKLLAEMAKDQDYQVWIERVDGSGKVGFVLEDGHVKSPVLAAA